MLTADEFDLVENILFQSKTRIDIEPENSEIDNKFIDYIRNSLLMSSYQDIYLYKLTKILDSGYDAHLLIVKVSYSIQNGRYDLGTSEPQLVGYKKLDFDYGHILIRPETFEDKISEIFTKSEIDFKNHPIFSSMYYFLSDDEFMANSFATPGRLKLLEKQREILVEINGDTLISKYSRKINSEDCESMIEFIRKI